MAKLCVNMIVKNEAANLQRCLDSLVGWIDCWVIADLGSTDGSQDTIRDFFAARGIPGLLVERGFNNFGQARNDALDACRDSDLDFDYILLIDAGMELIVDDPDFRDRLRADSYTILQTSGSSFYNVRLLKRSAGGRYRGVTNEYLEIDGSLRSDLIRLHSYGIPDPIARAALNIDLLKTALKTECDALVRARYTFYLGSNYRIIGDHHSARLHFLERSRLEFWSEEVYCARLYAVRCAETLNFPPAEVLTELAALNNDMMHRAEAMHGIARVCRLNGWWEQAYQTAEAACGIEKPENALFLEDWIYDYGALDELAIAAYWIGRYQESANICDAILGGGYLPADQVPRITMNRNAALEALSGIGIAV